MIKFILGRQTDPLQDKILDEATKNYKQNPENETFIIIPNHIKFTTEVKAISKLANKDHTSEIDNKNETVSVKNLQVLSFSRLAWYYLKDVEKGLPTQLDDAAAAMIVSQIIEDKRSELTMFANVNINSGLVNDLYQTILRIRESNLDLDEINLAAADQETTNKVHDLRIIYKEFEERIENKFSTKKDVLLQLNKLLNSRKVNLKDTSFYFSDFSHFSVQEFRIIDLLMQKAKNVVIAFKTKDGDFNPKAVAGDYDYVIQSTIKKLINLLNSKNTSCTLIPSKINPVPNKSEMLNNIWTENGVTNYNLDKTVQLVKADSRYAEAYFVARTIYQQVAGNHFRYKDFLILAPNLHEYETYLIPILRQNKIPFFNDLQQEMKYHPLVVLIEGLQELLLKGSFQTRNLLTILKTRLLIPSWYKDDAEYLHDVDELENFVLAHGINHNLWKRNFSDFTNAEVIRLDYLQEEVAKLDKLRSFFINKIDELFANLKQEKDSQKAITIFFNFLTENGIAARLEKWRDQANEAGDLQQAQQPEQLWDLLIQLLRDYLLIRPKNFDAQNFFSMLVTAFRSSNFSQIPSTLDAVNISEMGMVQETGYKRVFIIGATSGNLPNIEKTPGFLNSKNLENIKNAFSEDSYLEDSQQINNLNQKYQFGLALSLASDRTYISYPALNADNERLEPSIFYEQLAKDHAPEMQMHDLPEKTNDILNFITNPNSSLGYLTYLDETNPNKEVTWLLDQTKKYIPDKTEEVLKASHFNNQPEDIGPELAQSLYETNVNNKTDSKSLDSSVSQLETYYENSYEYFLTYGLRLRPRFENEFDVIQAGNYFHETFDRLVKELGEKDLDLAEISSEELNKLLKMARNKMKEEGKYAQLMNDPFNRFLFRRLDRTTTKVADNWQQNSKRTPLKAKFSELAFGPAEKIKNLDLEVPDLEGKHHVNLRGKMDRVDLADVENNQILAQVIDYKSSAKKFDLGLFYSGIALQMVSYLDVVSKNQKFFAGKNRLSLLGAFYQTVTQQLDRLNGKNMIGSDLKIKKAALSGKPHLLYKGLINNDPDLITEAEPLLKNAKTSSQLYSGLRSKANGGFVLPRNTNFSEEEIKLLLQYDEYLIKQAAHQILSGQIKLNPYRYGKGPTALTYSDYRDIFFFDAMLPENRYHEINSLDKKELLARIKEILNGKDKE